MIEHERAKLAHEVLDVAGPKLAADLEGIALKAAKEGNSNAVIMANAALYEAMKARLNANLVLARHEKGKAEDAETAFHGLGKALAQLEKVTGASAYKADVADAKALGTKYEEAFKASETLDEQFAEILEAEIIKPSEEAIAEAEKIKSETAQRESEDGEALSATILSSEILIVVLSCAAFLFGIAVAWISGRSISKPVMAMTAAMRTLAGGDTNAEIPARERRDEIGEMAASVQVFKDSMIEGNRLRAEQAKEQEAKERRQKVVDEAISRFEVKMTEVVKIVTSASTELQAAAQTLSMTAEETSKQSGAVAAAAEQASANVQTVASAAEELTSSVGEISRQVGDLDPDHRQGGAGGRSHQREGECPGRSSQAHQRGAAPDQRHRRPDQPAGAQRHHRGRARGRGRQGLCRGRLRGEEPRQPDRQGDRGDLGADRRDSVGHAGFRHRDRRHRQHGQRDQRHRLGDRRRGRGAGGGDPGDRPQRPGSRDWHQRGHRQHRHR